MSCHRLLRGGEAELRVPRVIGAERDHDRRRIIVCVLGGGFEHAPSAFADRSRERSPAEALTRHRTDLGPVVRIEDLMQLRS
jgi:hypothetical protein